MANKISPGCFENELLFPTQLKTFEKEEINENFQLEYNFRALIVRIDAIRRCAWYHNLMGDLYFYSRLQNNDRILVSFCFNEFYNEHDITAFSLSDLKEGNTLIVLDPSYCVDPFMNGISRVIVRDQNSCFFLNSSIETFKLEAERLLRTKDSMINNEEIECFGCGNKSAKISCSKCNLAKYCSNDCQKNSIKSHSNFCKHEEVLLRLASFSRHDKIKKFINSFKIDHDEGSLPVYKPKINKLDERNKENSVKKLKNSSE